jgi:hypothetical protein
MLSVAQSVDCRVVGWVKNYLKGVREETKFARPEIISRYVPEGNIGKPRRNSNMIANIPVT